LFQIYQAFATPAETEALRKAYAEGIAWGDAKQLLFERIDAEVAPLRERYEALMADPAQIERTLRAGAEKARALSRPFMQRLREAVGLRNLASAAAAAAPAAAGKPSAKTGAAFKQYREKSDGRFYFKLVDAQGAALLQSRG